MAKGVKAIYNDIIKSEQDKRLYRGIEFENGLKALLVSDPSTDKAAAALDVNIGKFGLIESFKNGLV